MMKTLNLILFIFLLPFLASSQTNFKPGYVINLKGDTIKGYIDYRGWDSSPTSISFKGNLNDKDVVAYTINDINYFDVTDVESYKKFNATISLDITDIDKLGYDKDSTFKVETVFFKVLQVGKNIALYSYTDNIKTRFFVGETPNYTPKELVYRVYKTSTDKINFKEVVLEGNTAIENTYLKQLFSIAIKYNVLDDKLTKILSDGSYKDYYLLDVVSRINQYKKTKINNNRKSEIKFFAGAGVNITSTVTSDDSQYKQSGGISTTSYLPLISGGINFIPNPNFGRLELRLEFDISKTKFDAKYKLLVSPFVQEKAYFDELNLILMPQIIYNLYKKNDVKIFIGAGYGLFFNNYSNEYFGAANSSMYDNGVGQNHPFLLFDYYEDLFFKVGFKPNKRLAFYINYLVPASISRSNYFEIVNNVYNVGLQYFFGN